MRALQHFDALKIQTGLRGQRRESQRNLVDIDRDCRKHRQRRVVEADPAQRVDGVAEQALGEGQARHDLGQVLDAGQPLLLQRFSAEGGHGQADLVQRFRALLRGHDDVADTGVVGRVGGLRCGLRSGVVRGGRGRQDRGQHYS